MITDEMRRLAERAIDAAKADVAARVKAGARLINPSIAADQAQIERNRVALEAAMPGVDELIDRALDEEKP